MRVRIVQRRRGGETVVGVVTEEGAHVVHACVGAGPRGLQLAVGEAVAVCIAEGYEILTPDGEVLSPVVVDERGAAAA
jgi:hypothetical protein